MKKSTVAFTALTLALLASLTACQNDGAPDPSITGDGEPLQTARVIGIRPAETRDPGETITFPPDPYPVVGPDTDFDIDPDMGVVPVDQVTLDGTIVESPYDWTTEDMLVVRVWKNGGSRLMVIYTDTSEEFCVGDRVKFTYDPSAGPKEGHEGITVWEVTDLDWMWDVAVAEKPVIYLYPEAPTEVSVKLTLEGELTCTYPAYGEGWNNFTARPDGTLIAPDGKEYYCLYWEGKQNTEWDFSEGFCVKGEDTAAFLEWALAAQGLTPREANEFIIYWLPRMEQNPYNVISFQTTAYTDTAALEITPVPDTLIRVFMAWYPSEEAVDIPAQSFEPVERSGFTAVEWGGSEMKRP